MVGTCISPRPRRALGFASSTLTERRDAAASRFEFLNAVDVRSYVVYEARTGLSTRGDTHTRMGVGCRFLPGGWVDFLPTPDQRMAMGDTRPTPIVTDVWMGG